MKRLAALLSVLVAMVAAAPDAAKPAIDARIRALERKVEALAVDEKVLRACADRTGKRASSPVRTDHPARLTPRGYLHHSGEQVVRVSTPQTLPSSKPMTLLN